jgi:leader peptidase (prepilin peptidase)/N-methyltransferase
MTLMLAELWPIYLYAALIGLIVGSYLNVLIHRIPAGKSTVLPRSRCPYCSGAIRFYDNLPVLSYLLLRGRCRHCKAPISFRYPAIEVITAALFVAVVYRFGIRPVLAPALVFVCLMVLLAAIDVEHFLLPDKITMPGILVGLALQFWNPTTTLLDAIVGVLVGAGLLILVINFWFWLRGDEGMGLGDVNMLALIGAFLGWQGVLTTLFLATLSGALVGLLLLAVGKLGLQSRLPFGLFLALGGIVSLFMGEALYAHYTGLL